MRRHYLITYDIADDRRRIQVFKMLSDNGDHEQYSVFFCQLSPMELETLKGFLRSTINHSDDQVLIVDLGKATTEISFNVESIGKGYVPPVRTMIV